MHAGTGSSKSRASLESRLTAARMAALVVRGTVPTLPLPFSAVLIHPHTRARVHLVTSLQKKKDLTSDA